MVTGRMFGRKKVPKDVVRARARVVRMAPTAKATRRPGKLDVEYSLRLSLDAPGRRGSEVDVIETIPHLKFVAMGHEVPVLLSASDTSFVAIDVDALPDAADRAAAAARAAESGDAAGVAEALGFHLVEPAEPPGDS